MTPIVEVFGPVVQGEGYLIGAPTVFVRTGGCDFRCQWCDTLYAVLPKYRDEWTKMEPTDILNAVKACTGGSPCTVTLSGGNPAMHPALGEFVDLAHAQGFAVACETQGSIEAKWFGRLDHLVVSPKPPSSLQADVDLAWVERLSDTVHTILKVPILNNADLDYAAKLDETFSGRMYVQPVGLPEQPIAERLSHYRWLADEVIRRGLLDWTVLPQLHVWAWGTERGR